MCSARKGGLRQIAGAVITDVQYVEHKGRGSGIYVLDMIYKLKGLMLVCHPSLSIPAGVDEAPFSGPRDLWWVWDLYLDKERGPRRRFTIMPMAISMQCLCMRIIGGSHGGFAVKQTHVPVSI